MYPAAPTSANLTGMLIIVVYRLLTFMYFTVFQNISLSTLRTLGFTITIKLQSMPIFTHPSNMACRVAKDQAIGRYILNHYSTSTDKSKLAYLNTTDDGCICTD